MSKARQRERKKAKTRKLPPLASSRSPILEGVSRQILDQTADVVHQAVCEATGSDGIGRCAWYADAGVVALRCLGFDTRSQAGSMAWRIDPARGYPDGWMTMDSTSEFRGIEFHTWVMVTPSEGGAKRRAIVDFSTRMLRAWYDRATLIPPYPQWTRKDPLPKYVWIYQPDFTPKDFRYRVYGALTAQHQQTQIERWPSVEQDIMNRMRHLL